MVFLILFLLIACAVCFLFRLKADGSFPGELDYTVTKYMKTILMLGVIIHHLAIFALDTDPSSVCFAFHKLFKVSGAYICAAFFFFSGYGLLYSISNKKDYLKRMHIRILSILIPYIIANVIYAGIHLNSICSSFEGESFIDLIQCFLSSIWRLESSGSTLVLFGWFIDQMILLYIIFWITNKHLTILKAIIVQTILCGLIIVMYKQAGWGGWRYDSLMAFMAGQIYCYAILSKRCPRCFRLCAFTLAICACAYTLLKLQYVPEPYILGSVLACPIVAIPFIISLTALKSKTIKIADFVSSFSLEAYLYQGVLFALCANLHTNTVAWSLCILLGSLLVGYVMHLVGVKALQLLLSKLPISLRVQ